MKIFNVIDCIDNNNSLTERFFKDIQYVNLEASIDKIIAFDYDISRNGISIGKPFCENELESFFSNEELADQKAYKYFSDKQKKWSDNFSKCILLTTYKELISSHQVQRKIWLYRHVMSQLKREEDIWLFIYDTDEVVTSLQSSKSYEDTYIDLHTILASCNEQQKSIFNPLFQDDIKHLNLLDFGQLITFFQKDTEFITKCNNVFFHWKSCAKSGYLELIYVLINDILDERDLKLTIMSYNSMYNAMFESIKKLLGLGTPSMHLAIIGSQGAGKTLLLRDLIEALHKMGMKSTPAQRFTPITEFNPGDEGKVGKTPIYAMRRSDIYDSTFDNGCIKVNTTFVNVPGDIFDKTRMSNTFKIFNYILKIKEKVFSLYEIKTDTGNNLFISYKDINEYKNSLPKQIKSDAIKPGFYANMLETLSFHGKLTSDNFEEERIKLIKKVSGKYIIEHYFDIDTDSIVVSLADYFIQYPIQGIKAENYFTDYAKDLSFHLYMKQFATDFIICDKLIRTDISNSGINRNADISLSTICDMLNMFLNKKQIYKKNMYLAFRAADVAIDKECFMAKTSEWNSITNNDNANINATRKSNFLYSLFCDSLYVNMGIISSNEITSQDFVQNNDASNEICYNYLDVLNKKTKEALISHIDDIIRNDLLRGLMPMGNNFQNNKHIYFTATPIDSKGEIHSNNAKALNLADFGNFNINRSLCFGSMQLAIDILKHHNSYPYENADTYGNVLEKIFGQDD